MLYCGNHNYNWPLNLNLIFETLEFLDKLQKQICRTTGPSLAAHHPNVASLTLFYMYYFGRSSSELVQQVPIYYS